MPVFCHRIFHRIGFRAWGLIPCAIVLLVQLGCGYRLAGSANNTLAPGQTVWVGFIANESISSTAQTVIRRALLDECHAMRGLLSAGNEAGADLRISGKLRSYSNQAISYTAIDQVREYRLTIDVELEIQRKDTGSTLWKGSVAASQDYPANNNLALQRSAEEAALAAASRLLAQRFLTAVEQSY